MNNSEPSVTETINLSTSSLPLGLLAIPITDTKLIDCARSKFTYSSGSSYTPWMQGSYGYTKYNYSSSNAAKTSSVTVKNIADASKRLLRGGSAINISDMDIASSLLFSQLSDRGNQLGVYFPVAVTSNNPKLKGVCISALSSVGHFKKSDKELVGSFIESLIEGKLSLHYINFVRVICLLSQYNCHKQLKTILAEGLCSNSSNMDLLAGSNGLDKKVEHFLGELGASKWASTTSEGKPASVRLADMISTTDTKAYSQLVKSSGFYQRLINVVHQYSLKRVIENGGTPWVGDPSYVVFVDDEFKHMLVDMAQYVVDTIGEPAEEIKQKLNNLIDSPSQNGSLTQFIKLVLLLIQAKDWEAVNKYVDFIIMTVDEAKDYINLLRLNVVDGGEYGEE